MPDENLPPLLTARTLVDRLRETVGIPLTYSRFMKDRMRGIAPAPVARFGNRDLFTWDQAKEYAAKLIQPIEAEDEAA